MLAVSCFDELISALMCSLVACHFDQARLFFMLFFSSILILILGNLDSKFQWVQLECRNFPACLLLTGLSCLFLIRLHGKKSDYQLATTKCIICDTKLGMHLNTQQYI